MFKLKENQKKAFQRVLFVHKVSVFKNCGFAKYFSYSKIFLFGEMLEKGHRSQKSASMSFLLEIKKHFKKINTTYFYFPVFSKRNF